MTELNKNIYLRREFPDKSIKYYYIIDTFDNGDSYKVVEAIEGSGDVHELTHDELLESHSKVSTLCNLTFKLANYYVLIENKQLLNFVLEYLDNVDPSFWTKPSSSTGKYHSEVENGIGGLYRHTIRVTEMMIRLMEAENITGLDKDCGIIAALLHDSCKYESISSKYTNFEHPIIASDLISSYVIELRYSSVVTQLLKISDMVASHSGRFTTSSYSDVVLPKPKTKLQKLLHYADMIASGKYSY